MLTLFALAALFQPPTMTFETPFLAESGGEPIRVNVGHAAPTLYDVDGDGVRDLVVGEFGGGGIRVYRNIGTNAEPRFDGFAMLEAGGAPVRIDAG